MAKDLRLKLLELRTGFDSELVDEAGACVLVHLEGLGLPARAIEREHQLTAERLAQRMLAGEPLELADHVAVQPELELGVDALADHDEPKLLEPSDLRLREVVECELRERRPAPQRERGLQKRAPLLRGKPPRVGERVLETTRIDLIRSDVEHIARRACVETSLPSARRRRPTAFWSDAVAVFGASSPQSESMSRSVGTTLPASSTRMARSARCFGLRARHARSRLRPRRGRVSGTRASRATLERRAGLCPASGPQITRCAQDPLKSVVSALLAARCRPVGDASDRAGHDSFSRIASSGGSDCSRPCARRGVPPRPIALAGWIPPRPQSPRRRLFRS